MSPTKASGSASPSRRDLLCGLAAAAAPGAGSVRVQDVEGRKVSVSCANTLLLEYCYGAARPKPYIHPLCLPGGRPLTLDGPEDHVHHRGLMVAWSAVNGYDFWGEVNPAPHGRIVHQRFLRCEGAGTAVIETLNLTG